MRNDYGQLLERWKVDLILSRAWRKGFQRHELEDVQQEVVLAILDFRFDPDKANGATESTALTAVVDRTLTFLQRGAARRRNREGQYCRDQGQADGESPCEPLAPDPTIQAALAMDVSRIVATLPPQQRAICSALRMGVPRLRIARNRGVSRYELDRVIDQIRERFQTVGLDEGALE